MIKNNAQITKKSELTELQIELEYYELAKEYLRVGETAEKLGFEEKAREAYQKAFQEFLEQKKLSQAETLSEQIGLQNEMFQFYQENNMQENAGDFAKRIGWEEKSKEAYKESMKLLIATGKKKNSDEYEEKVVLNVRRIAKREGLEDYLMELCQIEGSKPNLRLIKDLGMRDTLDELVEELVSRENETRIIGYLIKNELERAEEKIDSLSIKNKEKLYKEAITRATNEEEYEIAANLAKTIGLDDKATELYKAAISHATAKEEYELAANLAKSIGLDDKATELFTKAIAQAAEEGEYYGVKDLAEVSGLFEEAEKMSRVAETEELYNIAADLTFNESRKKSLYKKAIAHFEKQEGYDAAISIAKKNDFKYLVNKLYKKAIKNFEEERDYGGAGQISEELNKLDEAKMYYLLDDSIMNAARVAQKQGKTAEVNLLFEKLIHSYENKKDYDSAAQIADRCGLREKEIDLFIKAAKHRDKVREPKNSRDYYEEKLKLMSKSHSNLTIKEKQKFRDLIMDLVNGELLLDGPYTDRDKSKPNYGLAANIAENIGDFENAKRLYELAGTSFYDNKNVAIILEKMGRRQEARTKYVELGELKNALNLSESEKEKQEINAKYKSKIEKHVKERNYSKASFLCKEAGFLEQRKVLEKMQLYKNYFL